MISKAGGTGDEIIGYQNNYVLLLSGDRYVT